LTDQDLEKPGVLLGIAARCLDDTPENTRPSSVPALSQINFYPLSGFDGKMKTTDWTRLPHFPAPTSNGYKSQVRRNREGTTTMLAPVHFSGM